MTAAPLSPAPKFAADPRRRALLGKIHVAKKQLGLAQEDYAAIIARVTGGRATSAADLDEAQMDALLAEFERLGFRPVAGRGAGRSAGRSAGRIAGLGRAPAGADHPVAKKARAMWISLWNLGAVSSATESALEAFARRQLGVERLQWADQAKGYRLIEALKAMAERHGWSQAPARLSTDAPSTGLLLQRLIRRQVGILQAAGDDRTEEEIVNGVLHGRVARWTLLDERRLQQIAMELGKAVRGVQAR